MNRALVARAPCGCIKAVQVEEINGVPVDSDPATLSRWILAGMSFKHELGESWTVPEVCDKCRQTERADA